MQPLEGPCSHQPPRQRMRRRDNPHLTRQHRPQLLQSVAIFPGTGKTYLATGLAIRGCQVGHRVAFATAAGWVARLAEAHHAGRLQAELVRLGRYPLLVIDEVGYIPLEAEAANLFFQLVSARYSPRVSQRVTTVTIHRRYPQEERPLGRRQRLRRPGRPKNDQGVLEWSAARLRLARCGSVVGSEDPDR
jgi:hypothetical protein